MAEKKKPKMPTIARMTFEQAIEKLREIVEKVEAGQIGLEDAIRQYEIGCGLIQHCRKILDRAEHQIEVLTKNLEGALQSKPAPGDLTSDDRTD